jgi:hypothetical protein
MTQVGGRGRGGGDGRRAGGGGRVRAYYGEAPLYHITTPDIRRVFWTKIYTAGCFWQDIRPVFGKIYAPFLANIRPVFG